MIHNWADKWLHAFLKSINPKVNINGRLEFELAYYTVAVQHVNHFATDTLLPHFSLFFAQFLHQQNSFYIYSIHFFYYFNRVDPVFRVAKDNLGMDLKDAKENQANQDYLVPLVCRFMQVLMDTIAEDPLKEKK